MAIIYLYPLRIISKHDI